jgi:thiol-disulfide isomerase/thioredoxin
MSKPRHQDRGRSVPATGKAGSQRPGRARPPRRQSFWSGPWPIVGVLGGIVLLVAAFIVISRLQSGPTAAKTSPTADPGVVSRLAKVPPTVIDAVGTGSAASPLTRVSGTALTGSDGKPEVLYIGAEWCPYCAAERWAMIVALSHFGRFSGLRPTTSSSSDVYPDTHTLSFYGSTYASSYIDFVPVELEDRNRNPLQSMTAQQQQLAQTYDAASNIPFIDLGNAYTMIGQGVPASLLQGLSWPQIADALSNPASPVTKAIVGNSNYLTAAICKLPSAGTAPICSEPAIKAIAAQLPG